MFGMEYVQKLSEKHVGTERSILIESGALGGATPKVLVLERLDVGESLVLRCHGGNGFPWTSITEEPQVGILTLVHDSLNSHEKEV